MAKRIKLTRKRADEILKRVDDEPTFTPELAMLIREIFEDAIRIGVVKIKK